MRLLPLLLSTAFLVVLFARPAVPAPAAGTTGVKPGPRGQAAATSVIQGDVDCSGTVDSIDALQVLRSVASLPVAADCLAQAGDVDCSGQADSIDGLGILRFVASLNVQTPEGCTPIGLPLGPPTAAGLAHQLHAATTAGAGEAVLKLVYQHLGLAVYTKDGEVVQAGTQPAADDWYFYDFESELLARDYVDGQLSGLDTAALFLNEAGILNAGGQAMSAADVLALLAAKVTAARADESLFTWRLIDELGLAREDPLDLTTPGLDPDATFLDSLQMLLLLNEMTLGPSASSRASAGDAGAAGAPDARTKPMHDYSLLSQAYGIVWTYAAASHWTHPGEDATGAREMKVQLVFNGGEKVSQGITAGPLQEVALPLVGPVPGAVVDWFPDATLARNGAFSVVDSTTDEEGEAKADFVPRTECPTTAGTGPVVEEVGEIEVVARVEITSLWPPHAHLGVSSTASTYLLRVAHHTGTSPQAAGPAAAVAAAADETPPCAYEGTASATEVHHSGQGGRTLTVTASDLRFELTSDSLPGVRLYYKLVQGNVTVQASGNESVCTFSGGSSIPEPTFDGVHFFTGDIIVYVAKSEYFALGSVIDTEDHVVETCTGGSGTVTVFRSGYSMDWLLTSEAPAFRSFTPGGALEGSFDDHSDGSDFSTHYEWSLHPAECQPSPEPVCQ